MSLENLIGISLEKIEPHPAAITRLIKAAERNIREAKIPQIGTENRFDIAYKAVMQLANVALQANGFRTLTSKPGHHATMIQTLARSIGMDATTIKVLDGLRKQRNVADYSGDTVPESAAVECLAHAEALHASVIRWLKQNKPQLLE